MRLSTEFSFEDVTLVDDENDFKEINPRPDSARPAGDATHIVIYRFNQLATS